VPRRRKSRRKAANPGRAAASTRTSAELANVARNEQQKSILLREVGRMRRHQIAATIDESKRLLADSKKLCDNVATTLPKIKKAG